MPRRLASRRVLPLLAVTTLAVGAVACGKASSTQTRVPEPDFRLESTPAPLADGQVLEIRLDVKTRVTRFLPHHKADALVRVTNRGDEVVEVPQFLFDGGEGLSRDVFEIQGPDGAVPYRGRGWRRRDRVPHFVLQPGESAVGWVDLLEYYDFPLSGGTFRVHYEDVETDEDGNAQLRSNVVAFVVGPRSSGTR